MWRRVGRGPIGRSIQQSMRQMSSFNGFNQAHRDALQLRLNKHGSLSESARDELWSHMSDPAVTLPDEQYTRLLLNSYRRSFLKSSIPSEKLFEDFCNLSSSNKLLFHNSGFMALIEDGRVFDVGQGVPEIFAQYSQTIRTANRFRVANV